MQRLLALPLLLVAIASAVCAPHSSYPPYAIYAPPPRYTEEARREHLTGSGLFELRIRPDGTVERVTVLRTTAERLLDERVVTVLHGWRSR
jgi:TonB family protein